MIVLEKIKFFFDDFNFYARVMPIMVVLCPLIVYGFVKGILSKDWLETAAVIFIFLILLSFLSRISREYGKKYEAKMFENLKAKPTTIIMRYSDNRVDTISKKRYHEILLKKVDGVFFPDNLNDEKEMDDAMYESAMNWLRVYANSHRETEFRVYQELKEYHFWRNLYGIKNFAFTIYLIILIREIFVIDKFSLMNLIKYPYPDYIGFIVMAISFILVFFVNVDIIKNKAFDYAKALIEVCDNLGQDNGKK